MKKILKISFCITCLFVISLYLGVLFLLPLTINSKATVNKLESLIFNKTSIETNITGLNLKVSPRLLFILNVDSIDAKYKNVSVIDIKNLSFNYKLLQNHLSLVSAKNIYIDADSLKQFVKTTPKKKKGKFEVKKKPEIHIQKLTYKSENINIDAKNIDTKNEYITLLADIKTPYLKEILKIGSSGTLQTVENSLRANRFKITLGNSQVFLDGDLINKDKSFNFDLKGEKLPVSELMPILLHFQKSKDPAKKFIENFRNYQGSVDIDLKFNNGSFIGKCIAHNLSANAVWFNIPLYFKEAVFNFRGKEVDSVAYGILGREKVIHTLNITDLGTPQKEVIGTMKTTLTKKFDYVPNLTVLNYVNASLIYKIKSKKPDVYYSIDIPQNSDLIYNSFYLGLRDYKRKIYANTFKDGNNLYLKEYKYAYSDSNKENIVVSGDGFFVKINEKFTPQYLNCHTNGYAPISVTGSFGEKVKGGEFRGDLKYDFANNQVLGTFDIINAKYKEFDVEQANIGAKNGIFKITAKGRYKKEKFFAQMDTKNNFIL